MFDILPLLTWDLRTVLDFGGFLSIQRCPVHCGGVGVMVMVMVVVMVMAMVGLMMVVAYDHF